MKSNFLLMLFLMGFIFMSCESESKPSSPKNGRTEKIEMPVDTAKIMALISQKASYERLSGAFLIAKHDTVLVNQAFGMANRKENTANSAKMPFDIGSLTKQFTGAGILHLVKSGKLNLNTPINEYLGNEASKEWKDITIHHLLTHTSGIPSLMRKGQGLDHMLPQPKPIAIEKLIDSFKNLKTQFSEGEEFFYSNSGYVLLAYLIEKATGKSYKTFMEEEIFQKYGLENTTVGTPNRAFALPYYNYRAELTEEAPLNHYSWFVGAGGIYSTTSDLHKWVMAINSKDFLNAELRSKYFSPVQKNYAYGWQASHRTPKIIWHDGANLGYISQLKYFPASGLTIIALTNHSHAGYEMLDKSSSNINQLTEEIEKIVWEEDLTLPPNRIEESKASSLAGTFTSDWGLRLKIEEVAGTYRISQLSEHAVTPVRLAYEIPLKDKNQKIEQLTEVAEALKNKKVSPMKKYMSGEMKFAATLGLIKMGLNQILKPLGNIEDALLYKSAETHAVIRMKGENHILDIIVYFDEDGKIDGLFEHGEHSIVKPQTFNKWNLPIFPLNGEQWLIDGFPQGEQDVFIKPVWKEGEVEALTFIQNGRSFLLTKAE